MLLSKCCSPIWAVVLGVLLLSGCETPKLDVETDQATSSSPTDSQPKAIEQAPVREETESAKKENGNEDKSNLSAVFESWESGAKDEAINRLLQIDWESPAVSGNLAILDMTEKDFAALSRTEKEKEQAVAMKLAGNSKAILRHAFTMAEQAEREGDNARAKLYYQGVQRLGNALAGSERLAVLQVMGKSLVQMADEKLKEQK